MQQNTTIRLNVIEKPPGQTGCAVIPKRWLAERSIAWAKRNRLASKDYNRNPESSKAFLYLDSIAMLLNRLYPRCSFLITLLGGVKLPFELLPCVEPSIAKLHPQFYL